MKKSKKILSVVLALTMAFSALAATFAASAADDKYTPAYTEIATQKSVTNTIKAVDALIPGIVTPLLDQYLNKDALVPMLSDLLKSPSPLDAKQTIADLIGGPLGSGIVNPILAQVDHLVNTTLGLNIGMPFAKGATAGTYVLKMDADTMANQIADWAIGAINTLKTNLVETLLTVLPILAQDSTLQEIAALIGPESSIQALVNIVAKDADGNPLLVAGKTIPELINGFLADNNGVKQFDVNAAIQSVLGMIPGAEAINVSEIDMAALAGLDNVADTFMFVYDYAYANLFADEDNFAMLKGALAGVEIDEGTLTLINQVVPGLFNDEPFPSKAALLDMVVGLLGGEEDETTTNAPSTTAPSTTAPTTGTKNPGTGDAALGAVAMITVAAAAAFVMTKKKA